MSYLQAQNRVPAAKAAAIEAARKMQTIVIDAANKADRVPPKYALKELVGKGSFGAVYKGMDVSNAAVVAVKIIDIDKNDAMSPGNEDSYSDFMKEFKALKLMSENKARNINHLIEVLSVGKTMWIVTDYCGGGSVSTLMKPTAPGGLEEKWIIPILREVAEAIRWVHGAGIIHRDIKSSNVLITELGEVKLCDFGVASKLESNIDKRSSFIGTPHWMAPELFESSRSYGKEVDIWSFGAMVYEIATGYPPNVKDGVPCENLGVQLRTKTTRLEGDNFSDQLKSLVSCCLVLHPSLRPSIEHLQKHPYLFNSHSLYPTVNLAKLVKIYFLWERGGNGRESLIMSSSGTIDHGKNVDTEEWDFDTSSAFDGSSASKATDPKIPKKSHRQVEVKKLYLFDSSDQEPLNRPSNSRSSSFNVAPRQSPLEKAFDPNTLSNYDDNSRQYYSHSSQHSGSESFKTSHESPQVGHGRFSSGVQASSVVVGLGISALPQEESEHGSIVASYEPPTRSESGSSTKSWHTMDWKFPSVEEQLALKALPDSHFAYDGIPFPEGESHFDDRPPSQVETSTMPTDPIDWFHLHQSITDLDLSIPEFCSPVPSMGNPGTGSGTPGPFQMRSEDRPIEKTTREPSLDIDDGSAPSMNVGLGSMVNSSTASPSIKESKPTGRQSTSLFEIEKVSEATETPSAAAPITHRRQARTGTRKSKLPGAPSHGARLEHGTTDGRSRLPAVRAAAVRFPAVQAPAAPTQEKRRYRPRN